MTRLRLVILLASAFLLITTGMAVAHDDPTAHVLGDDEVDTPLEEHAQHGDSTGHLPASSSNVELIGNLDVSGAVGGDRAGHIADVAVSGNFAYLAARRLNTSPCGQGGVYVIDISDPTEPVETGFIAFPADSYPGEGMQVIKLNTKFFKGDVLLTNNENCGGNPDRVGGVSLYDVTDPLDPKPLAIGKGDTNGGALTRARQIHSVFGWQNTKGAFAIIVDNEEVTDVDILDITDPRNPVMIKETGILDWPAAHSPLANGESVFLHDLVVKKVRGNWLALLSYWDAGWIILNVNDPANPVFVDDSNYPDPEPLLGFSPPEGNAHQGEWSHNGKYILGTDEDFSPGRTSFEITDGPNAGVYGAGQFGWTVPISDTVPFAGSAVWGGTGCVEDVNGNGISDRAEVPSQSDTGADVVVFTRGTCFFSIKVESGQLAGYDKVIIGQSHGGTRSGLTPNGFTCGGQGHAFTITASAICIGHTAMHNLFDDPAAFVGADGADMPTIGTLGASVSASTTFDGWGGVNLLDAATLQTVDSYAVAEGLDEAYASGFGNLTVHEVAMDQETDLGYLSYYDAGLRVVQFGPSGIVEVGHYIAEGGNDFWGVEAHRLPGDPTETTYILMSDRDSGLWIFRYTGPTP